MQAAGISEYVQLLRSADVEQRRQAIIALGRSKQPAALQPLAEVYRNETNPELRELALRAGKYIKAQATAQTGQTAGSSPVTTTPLADGEVRTAQSTASRAVSDRAVKAAKAAIEDTLSSQARGDIARAIRSLRKAYRYNPELIGDTFFVSLAMSLLDCDESSLRAALQDDGRAHEVVRSSEDQQAQAALAAHIEEVTKFRWTAVSLDIALFGLLAALGPVLLTVVLGESLRNWLALVANDEAAPNEALLKLAEFVGAMDLRSLAVLSVTLLASGLLSLLVQCVAIHISATRYLGGTGTLRYLMYKLVSYFNRSLLTGLVVSFVSIWLFVSNGFLIGLLPVAAGLTLFALVKFIKVGDRIGEAYKFSSGGGCVSVVVASIVLVVANSAIAYLVYLVLGSVLSQIFPALPQ